MRLHDRYLFRELLTPLAYCLGGFLVFWVAYFFFSEIDTMQEHQLRLLDCAEYAAAMMPGFLILVLPIALLLALLYALTQHSRHHELTALRAAGVSLWRLCAPYFIVGTAAGGIYFGMNEIVVPRCANWTEEILSRHVQVENNPKEKTHFTKTGFRTAHANRIWQIGDYDAVTRIILNPNVAWPLPDGSQRQLVAERAGRTNNVWIFSNVKMFTQSPHGSLVPAGATNLIAMPEFDETPRQILSSLKMNDSQTLLVSHNADIPLKDLRDYFKFHPDMPKDVAAKLLTKYYGRLALPWTCLVVVFIAIPFGAQSGRRNLFFGVAGSIFICFSYFVLQQVSLTFGASGILPAWLAAWLPNLFFATAGTILIVRTR